MSRVRSWIFENDLGALAYRLLTEQPLWRRQIAGLVEHFGEHRRGSPEAPLRILDLGCGPGVSSFVLAEAVPGPALVTGVDISAPMIERARALLRQRYAHLSGLSFLCADALDLPLRDASFDVVTGHSFLYIIGERERALREIARVLVPGGRLVLMEPARDGSLLSAARGALPDLRAGLREPRTATRFAASMLLWRLFSSLAGRLTPELARSLFAGADLELVAAVPTLGGLGWHFVGRRPTAR
jgi:ubiquinone/menaquinone biosynthesis C-methylase UbiE